MLDGLVLFCFIVFKILLAKLGMGKIKLINETFITKLQMGKITLIKERFITNLGMGKIIFDKGNIS